jgi:hypothetical protein
VCAHSQRVKVARFDFGELIMQTIEQKSQPDLFEVVLCIEGDSWLFSTCAEATRLQEALERAEKEFSVHSMHHQLGNRRMEATSAYVRDAEDHHSFAKRDGMGSGGSPIATER